jgi:hypothetical protein
MISALMLPEDSNTLMDPVSHFHVGYCCSHVLW